MDADADARDGTDGAFDGFEVLEKLIALPISTWNYKSDPPSVRHLGPMAQDFMAAFALGADDTVINMVDANGVVMVAIQALHRKIEALEAEVARLTESVHQAREERGVDPAPPAAPG